MLSDIILVYYNLFVEGLSTHIASGPVQCLFRNSEYHGNLSVE